MTEFYAIRNDGFSFKTLDLGKLDILRWLPDDASASMDDVLQLSLRNIAMAEWWVEPETRFISNEGITEPKMPEVSVWAADAALVLSPRAKRLLGDTLAQYGELLPVTDFDSGDTYWLFNCLTCSDVDEANSAYEYMGDTPISLSSLTLPDSAQALKIFKVPFEGCVTLYCTDYLKDAVAEYELTGLRFDSNFLDPIY